MTNAEKYLKDGVDFCELIRNIADYKPKLETSDNVYAKMQEFFCEPAKPTLTEDERVILRNIDKQFTHISREYDDIWVGIGEETEDSECTIMRMFNHLFQFIKNGEEYSIKELLD